MVYSDEIEMNNILAMIFGGAEILIELVQLIDYPEFKEALAEYGRAYGLEKDELDQLPEELSKKVGRNT